MRTLKHSILIAALLAAPTGAFAQRVPHADSAAVGGDVGVFIPREEALKWGPALEGFYEYYFSGRNSLRIGLGWLRPRFDREEDDSIRYIRVPVDVVYNWEGGAVHPFVGAGLGIYFLQQQDNGNNVGESQTKLGGTLFGGLELFTDDTVSFKVEARYHAVQRTFIKPDGLALTIGLKKYF